MNAQTAAPNPRSVRSLPVQEWSEADRQGWEAACRPGRRFTRGGAASHMAAVTQTDLANRFLDRFGWLDHSAEAAAVVVPEFIASFIEELQDRVSSVTVSRTIYKVRRAAECIAPGRDFAWLAEIGKDLAMLERPKDKFDRVVLTERVLEAALVAFWEIDAASQARPFARAFSARNALMVAQLAACPIRLKNFSALETQERFRWIFLNDTKSRRPDHRPVPDFLAGAIERYLEAYRPTLLSNSVDQETNGNNHRSRRRKSTRVSPARITSALWISRFGDPMSYGQVECVITATSYRLIGVCLSPHLFRVAGATAAALYSPSPHLGSALLQHSNERDYQ